MTILDDLRRGGDNPKPLASFERFVSPADIAKDRSLAFSIPNRDGKIFLGLNRARVETRGGTRHAAGGQLIGVADDRHWVCVAGNRAGKSRSLILPNLLTYPGSMIVIDPKGDLATETAAYRANTLGQRVFVLDPFKAAGEAATAYRGSYNPLQHVDTANPDLLIAQASLIADALVKESSGENSHWDATAKQFIEGVVIHVLTAPQYKEKRNLSMVHSLIAIYAENKDDTVGINLEREMCTSIAANQAVLRAGYDFYQKSDRERAGVLSTIRRHLHFLGYPGIGKVLGDSDLDLMDMTTKPITLYLSLPAMQMTVCAGWLRLFVNMALSAFERNSARREFQHQTSGHRVLMCLDEFNILGRLTTLSNAAGQVAGLGCKLHIILQDLTQIQAHYKSEWETFLGNAGCLNFFGNMDIETLGWIEKRMGDTQVFKPSYSAPNISGSLTDGATGNAFSLESHPLMTIPEISRYFGRDDQHLRQLVMLAGRSPMILQRAYYDQHEAFRTLLRTPATRGRRRP